jgi:hypothetical protein
MKLPSQNRQIIKFYFGSSLILEEIQTDVNVTNHIETFSFHQIKFILPALSFS